MVRSHPTHNRTRLWPLTTCMGFGFGITRQFLQRYKSGSLSVSSRWHRVRPLTTTAAWGRVKSTSHGASQTRRTRWMLWSGACHCLLYLTPLTVPNVDQAADPRSPTPVSIPSLLHPPISGALPLRAPAARPTGDQQVRRPRAQLTAASSKVSTPRSSISSKLVWVAWFVWVETFCQFQFLPSG